MSRWICQPASQWDDETVSPRLQQIINRKMCNLWMSSQMGICDGVTNFNQSSVFRIQMIEGWGSVRFGHFTLDDHNQITTTLLMARWLLHPVPVCCTNDQKRHKTSVHQFCNRTFNISLRPTSLSSFPHKMECLYFKINLYVFIY